jgi:hypothetical protein
VEVRGCLRGALVGGAAPEVVALVGSSHTAETVT